MEFRDLVQKRRSIRKFTDEKLPAEYVEAIMRTALKSPASKRANPWQFVLVEDKEVLGELSFCKKSSGKFIADCALAIVVLADPITSDVWIEDASIASIMIQLQVEDLGLGSCWVQIRNRETPNNVSSEEYIRILLDIPLQLQVLSVIAIGYKAKERSPFDENMLQWEKIHIGKYKLEKE